MKILCQLRVLSSLKREQGLSERRLKYRPTSADALPTETSLSIERAGRPLLCCGSEPYRSATVIDLYLHPYLQLGMKFDIAYIMFVRERR